MIVALLILMCLLLAGVLYWWDSRGHSSLLPCRWSAESGWLAFLAAQFGGLVWMRLWAGAAPLVLQVAFSLGLILPGLALLRGERWTVRGWWRWGVASYAMAFLGALLFSLLIHPEPSVNPAALWLRESQGWGRLGWLGMLCLLAPMAEEIWYRVFLSGPHQGRLLLSALAFALAHADPGAFFILLWLGGWLAWARWRGGLAAAVLGHALWNTTTAIWIMGA